MPQPPYQKSVDSNQIPEETKKKLQDIRLSLNPAQLRQSTDAKLDKLYRAYEQKSGTKRSIHTES